MTIGAQIRAQMARLRELGLVPVRIEAGRDANAALLALVRGTSQGYGPINVLDGVSFHPLRELAADEWAFVFRMERQAP